MKAYRDNEGHVRMFRPMENVLRMNSSIERLCLPVHCFFVDFSFYSLLILKLILKLLRNLFVLIRIGFLKVKVILFTFVLHVLLLMLS